MDHVFQECIWASQIWFSSPLGFRFASQKLMFVVEWVQTILLEAPSQVKEMVALILYNIWWAKNVKVHEFNHILVSHSLWSAQWPISSSFNLVGASHDSPLVICCKCLGFGIFGR